MKDLKGKTAVVTGAASGIGRAVAEKLAGEGMNVVLADIEEKSLKAAAKEMKANGATVLAVPTDVSKGDSVDALAEATLKKFGAVHVLHNNAGVGAGGMSWELTTEDWEWVLGVNLWGVIHGIRAFVPHMVAQNEGHVVNTASMAGLISGLGMGPYNASKHAVVTISETLFYELSVMAPNVHASVLCPGWVNTKILESERNRPDTLRNVDDDSGFATGPMASMVSQWVADGLPPSEVANLVHNAIINEQFYILTHPEWAGMITDRTDDIANQRNPRFPSIPS
ncbi:MAG: SDR family NAD(P)-dependent oxidoreductase [Actinobacteria bacterium]|nr:SDR family NAD(P)-dependent oxidoreductase [Actinomycetota bacterium]